MYSRPLERIDATDNKPGAQAFRIKKFHRIIDMLTQDLDIIFQNNILVKDLFLVFGSSLISAKEIYVSLIIDFLKTRLID